MAVEDVFTIDGDTGEMVLGSLLVVKDTTGHTANPSEGQAELNTVDKTLDAFMLGAWITIGSW